PPRLDRPRLDSPPEPHHRNFISSELRTCRASAETISVVPTLSTRRRASSLFEISSDKAKAPTQERQTRPTRSIIETQTLRTATKYLKPATQSCCSLHPRRLEPTTAKLKKLPPPENKSRRQRSCGSLHLPKSKPTLRASSTR
ncbi:unnamed protein product, partial [Brassica napus]